MEPQQRRALGVVFLVVVVDLLGFGVLLPLLAQYGDKLHATDLEIGLLAASFSLVQFVFSPLWGRLSDRIGRRPVLMGGLFASASFYLLFAYAAWEASLAWMFVARIGAGAAGATIATAQAYVADVTTKEERTRSMALIGMAFGLGFVFGPLLGVGSFALFSPGASTGHLSPLPGLLAACLSATALVLAYFLLPETLRNSEDPREADVRFSASAWRMVFTRRTLAWAVFAFFASTLGFTQFEGTLSLLLRRVYSMEEKSTYGTFLYLGFIFALSTGAVRPLTKKLSDETLSRIGVFLILLGILLGMAALRFGNYWTLLAVMPVVVFGFAMVTPTLQSMVSKQAPADRQGAVMGINQAASALARVIGMAVGPILLGANLYLPYLTTAALMIFVMATMIARLPFGPPASPTEAV